MILSLDSGRKELTITLGQGRNSAYSSCQKKDGDYTTQGFLREDLTDIHYALHNIVLPLSNVLVPVISQHKRISSIHCIYGIMHISNLSALSKGQLTH
jgi:cell division FtsZ-interacting protein ZapD